MTEAKTKTLSMDPRSREANVAIHSKWAVVDRQIHSLDTRDLGAKDGNILFEIKGTRPASTAEQDLWRLLTTSQAEW